MGTAASVVASLEAEACWELLRTAEVGRLAVAVAGRPDVFPLNFTVDRGDIVFCTAEGTKLVAMFVNGAVAFECDGESGDDAWSIVVKGRVEEIPMHDLLESSAYALYPWAATVKSRFLRIIPEQISGRRFHIAQRRPT